MRARVHDLRDGHALPPRLFLRGEFRPLLAGPGGRVCHLAGAAERRLAAPRLRRERRLQLRLEVETVDAFGRRLRARLRRRERGEHHRRRDRRDEPPRPAPPAPPCETHPGFRLVFASAAFLSHAVGGGGGAAGASGTGETSSSEAPPRSELERSSEARTPAPSFSSRARGSGSTLETHAGFDETRASRADVSGLGFINPSDFFSGVLSKGVGVARRFPLGVGVFMRALAARFGVFAAESRVTRAPRRVETRVGVAAEVFASAARVLTGRSRVSRRAGAGEFITLLEAPPSTASTSPPSAAAIADASMASKSAAGGLGPSSSSPSTERVPSSARLSFISAFSFSFSSRLGARRGVLARFDFFPERGGFASRFFADAGAAATGDSASTFWGSFGVGGAS